MTPLQCTLILYSVQSYCTVYTHTVHHCRAPVKSLLYNTPYSRANQFSINLAVELYRMDLEVYAHRGLPRFSRSRSSSCQHMSSCRHISTSYSPDRGHSTRDQTPATSTSSGSVPTSIRW